MSHLHIPCDPQIVSIKLAQNQCLGAFAAETGEQR